jgi:CubicO group peptidase (beta-lactamase class C family)
MKKLSFLIVIWLAGIANICAQPASENIKAAIQPFVDAGDISGIVSVIADRDKVLSVTSIGFQDIETKKAMDADVLFWIASQSKPIAATAVMMLVDEGKINLDEPVTTYLPELNKLMVSVAKRENWQAEEKPVKPVTLRHLLSHTSGMAWVAGVQEQTKKIDILPFSKSIYVSAMTPLLFHPGERYSYSNQGINIAATVVERVSGMPFETFLQIRLFDPLGMKSATFWPNEKQIKKLATAYTKGADGKLAPVEIDQLQYPLSDRNNRFAEAAGGLFCSPNDLVKFYRMIANKGVLDGKRYLNEATVEEMGKKQTGERVADQYGLGWGVSETLMGHGGAYGTDSKVYKKSGYVVMYFILGAGLPKQGDAFNAFYKAVNELYNLE